MNALLLAAIIACSDGTATCTSQDSGELRLVTVCGISPESPGERVIRLLWKGRPHVIAIQGTCDEA